MRVDGTFTVLDWSALRLAHGNAHSSDDTGRRLKRRSLNLAIISIPSASVRMLQIFSRLALIFLIFSSKIFRSVSGRPMPTEAAADEIKTVDKNMEQDPPLVGGNLDLLISDMYNRIIKERLENLLEGVSHSVSDPIQKQFREELLESSESLQQSSEDKLNEKQGAFEEPEKKLVEISLPISVTEIPRELFTSLPGTF